MGLVAVSGDPGVRGELNGAIVVIEASLDFVGEVKVGRGLGFVLFRFLNFDIADRDFVHGVTHLDEEPKRTFVCLSRSDFAGDLANRRAQEIISVIDAGPLLVLQYDVIIVFQHTVDLEADFIGLARL